MDKATLFVMAVLFEAQAAQDAFRIRTSLFLNLNFGQLAAKAGLSWQRDEALDILASDQR